MRKIILLALVLYGFTVAAQTLPTYPGYTNINSGYQWLRGLFAALGAPAGGNAAFATGQLPRAGALYYDSTGTDSGFYYYSGTAWRLIGGAGIDSTLASQGNQMSGDTVVFAGPIGTPGVFSNERTINTNRLIMHWTNGIAAEAGGAYWQFTKRPYSPFQFISSDTVTTNSQALGYARPLSGLFARRILYFNSGVYRVTENYGQYLGLTYNFQDSMNARTDGGDFGQAVQTELRIKARGSGRQVISTGHTTSLHLRKQEGVAALTANWYLDGSGTGAPGDYTYVRGTGVAFTPYLVMNNTRADSMQNFVFIQPGAFAGGGANVSKVILYGSAVPDIPTVFDSVWFAFDTTRNHLNYLAGNTLIGPGDSTVTQAKFKVNGSALFNGWSGYWANVAADYTARSFTDKNYVDSAIAAAGGGTPDLQDVLNVDNNTTTSIFFNSGSSSIYSSTGGLTFDHGGGNTSYFQSGTDANKYRWYPAAGVPYFNMDGSLLSTTRNLMFPDEDDTIATRSFARSVAGGISDGDKGDIDVTSSGTVWTIDTAAVTNIKINDVEWSKVTSTPTTIDGYGITDSYADAGAVLSSDFGLADVATDQTCFPSCCDEFTLTANTTYEFEGFWNVTKGNGAVTTAIGFTLSGGLTLTSMKYPVFSYLIASVNAAPTASQATTTIDNQTSTIVTVSSSTVMQSIYFKGIMRVNSGGVLTPILKFSSAPGTTGSANNMKANSWLKFRKIGSGSVTVIGNVN